MGEHRGGGGGGQRRGGGGGGPRYNGGGGEHFNGGGNHTEFHEQPFRQSERGSAEFRGGENSRGGWGEQHPGQRSGGGGEAERAPGSFPHRSEGERTFPTHEAKPADLTQHRNATAGGDAVETQGRFPHRGGAGGQDETHTKGGAGANLQSGAVKGAKGAASPNPSPTLNATVNAGSGKVTYKIGAETESRKGSASGFADTGATITASVAADKTATITVTGSALAITKAGHGKTGTTPTGGTNGATPGDDTATPGAQTKTIAPGQSVTFNVAADTASKSKHSSATADADTQVTVTNNNGVLTITGSSLAQTSANSTAVRHPVRFQQVDEQGGKSQTGYKSQGGGEDTKEIKTRTVGEGGELRPGERRDNVISNGGSRDGYNAPIPIFRGYPDLPHPKPGLFPGYDNVQGRICPPEGIDHGIRGVQEAVDALSAAFEKGALTRMRDGSHFPAQINSGIMVPLENGCSATIDQIVKHLPAPEYRVEPSRQEGIYILDRTRSR